MGTFGKPKNNGMPGIITGYGGGTWNADGSQATLPDVLKDYGDAVSQPNPMNWGTQDPTATQTKKPGAFGKDGWAWKVLGTIGDGLQVAGGGKATYMPAFLDQMAQEKAQQQQYAQQAQLFQSALNMGMTPDQARVAMMNTQAMGARAAAVGMPDPIRFANKAGDQIQIGPDGKPVTLYTDTTPDIVPVQGSGVYAMDRHTGKQFGSMPEGFTPLTPEEIQAHGLPPQGPGQNQSPPPQVTRPTQTISQAEYMNLQRIHGPAGAAAFIRQHNIAIGN